MIIDLILDRKGGAKYDKVLFVFEVNDYWEIWPDLAGPILEAFRTNTEQIVKHALCGYVLNAGYNPEICDYINSVKWC